MSNCDVDASVLPIILGCPSDDELVFVGNVVGGYNNNSGASTGYGFRKWSDIKRCVTSVFIPPLVGVVDGGDTDDPVSGISTFQDNKLKGLGASNNYRIQIVIDEVLQSNFGVNASFTFDGITGTIDLSPNTWQAGSGLYINLNQ